MQGAEVVVEVAVEVAGVDDGVVGSVVEVDGFSVGKGVSGEVEDGVDPVNGFGDDVGPSVGLE